MNAAVELKSDRHQSLKEELEKKRNLLAVAVSSRRCLYCP